MALDVNRQTRFVIHLHDRNINFLKSKDDEVLEEEVEFFRDGKLQSTKRNLETKTNAKNPLQNALTLIAALQGSDACGVDKLPNSKCNELFDKMAGGLHNPGINICFMNVIVQVLVHSPYIAPAMLKSAHTKVCPNAKRRIVCVMCTLEAHIKKGLSSRAPTNNPFVHLIQKLVWKQYRIGRQEDAFIFLKHFLEALIKGCYGSRYPYNASTVIPQNDLMRSFIGRIFGGFLLNVVICSSCNYKSEKLEPCFDISVDVYRGNKLLDLLSSFVQLETLDNNNKYNCPSCKKHQKATKAMSIYRAPRIMNVTLKRFEVGALGCEKTKKEISFPLSFSMSLKTTKQSQPVWITYDLYAVVCHLGSSLHIGHYITFIKGQHGFWNCLNDSVVTTVSQKTVISLKQEAYLLFYAVKDECVQICDLVLNDDSITNTFTTEPVPRNRNLESTITQYRKDVLREDADEEERGNSAWKEDLMYEESMALSARMAMKSAKTVPTEKSASTETPENVVNGHVTSDEKQKSIETNVTPKSRQLKLKRHFVTRRKHGYRFRLFKLFKQQQITADFYRKTTHIKEELKRQQYDAVKKPEEYTPEIKKQEGAGFLNDPGSSDNWSDAEVDETYENLKRSIHPVLGKRSQDDIDYDRGKTKKVKKPSQPPLGHVQVVEHQSGAKIAVRQKSAFDEIQGKQKRPNHSKYKGRVGRRRATNNHRRTVS